MAITMIRTTKRVMKIRTDKTAKKTLMKMKTMAMTMMAVMKTAVKMRTLMTMEKELTSSYDDEQ